MGTGIEPTVSVEFEVFGLVQGKLWCLQSFQAFCAVCPRSSQEFKNFFVDVWDLIILTFYNFLGVYFTKYCKELCEQMSVSGWIKNTKKGTIQGKMQGSRSSVEYM